MCALMCVQLIMQEVTFLKRQPEAFPSNCFNTHPEAVFFKSFLLQVMVEEESDVAAYLCHADVPPHYFTSWWLHNDNCTT